MSGGYLNKKQRIVAILRAEYEKASEAFRHAYATRISMDATANAWDDSNPGENPYSGDQDQLSKREEEAKLYAAQMREAYEFAVDTFLKNE